MARIYVASSWRNQYYPEVVDRLRAAGHEVYDFRNPPSGAPVMPGPDRASSGFHWTDVDPDAADWDFAQYAAGLRHPLAERQFKNDIDALTWADTCVLVLPCGRSAHTEAGWMAGRGKRVIAYIPEMVEPELMYKLFDAVVGNLDDLIKCLYDDKEILSEKFHKYGLDPWVGENPRVLILGTMAGDTSIAAQAYYDDPRNPFWKIMDEIFSPSEGELSQGKKSFITARGIALWDCIACGVRIDSSDASFSERTLKGNDIQGFLYEHPSIHTIVLNGSSTTVKYFNRYCNVTQPIRVIALPSTASMTTYKSKVDAWSIIKNLFSQ